MSRDGIAGCSALQEAKKRPPVAEPPRPGHDSRVALPDGFTLVAEVFDPAWSEAHLEGLLADLEWEEQRFTIYGRTMPMPRLVAMYGPVGYRYSGVVHPPRRLSPRLDLIRRRVEEVTGRAFNSVLANLYRDGRDSVGWHRDSDYAHGDQPDIASVSFGATRRFELRDRTGGVRAAVELEAGSVLVISGDAVARWWHRVPKTSRAVGPRVNLTFRHMVADG
jgi:alkylated DNA repair dioxygenase AlkB